MDTSSRYDGSIVAALTTGCRFVSRCSARVTVTAMGSLLGVAGRRRVAGSLGLLFVQVLLERDASERAEIDAEGRVLDFSEPPLHALEAGLRSPDARGHAAERRDPVIEIERLLIRLGRACEIVALLRH